MKNPQSQGPNPSDWYAFALLGQVGLTIVIPCLLGIGAGLFIDNHFHTSPIATLIGLLLGLAVGIYGVFRLISSL